MAITPDRVRDIFKGLESGDGAAFFDHVADNVDWIVEGTHPHPAVRQKHLQQPNLRTRYESGHRQGL